MMGIAGIQCPNCQHVVLGDNAHKKPCPQCGARLQRPECPWRGHKYGAKPVTADGEFFASTREYQRWLDLLLLQKSGIISGLQRQVPITLHALGGLAIARYIADFVYLENGERVVEDVKGCKTAMYALKKKWVKAEHGIDIKEV